jgi:N-acetylglucosaminyl-diphospho-decaprenol L-rhamnosyltransferase
MPAPVAIAVVSWNTRDLLDACLASLHEDARSGLAEVWVVDNGSTDGSPEMVRDRHPWVRLMIPDANLGYGPAVNRVAERSDAPWVVASNADIEVEPGAVGALLEVGLSDPRAGVIGPRLILSDASTQPGVQPYPSVGNALLRNLWAYKLSRRVGERLCLAGYWDPAQPAVVDWVTGAFLLIRREAYEQIGGFDESQWMYAEDLDICWRAHHAGWNVRYAPQSRVRHALSVAAAKAFGDVDQRAVRMIRQDYAWLARRQGKAAAWAVGVTEIATLALRRAILSLGGERGSHKAGEVQRRLTLHRAGISELRR